MDFNLNLQPPPGFESALDNEFVEWNVGYEQISDVNEEEEAVGNEEEETVYEEEEAVANDEEEVDARQNDDLGGDSRLHNDADNFELSSDEEDPGTELERLTMSFEERLAVGSLIDSLNVAYVLYKNYGKCKGFSVKKAGQKYHYKTKIVYKKEYQCSCECVSSTKELDRLHEYKKQDNRCKCPALLRVVLRHDGKWCVTKFDKQHSHELVDQDHAYMLLSCRKLSPSQKYALELMYKSGIKIKDVFRFMENEAGGLRNAGFMRKDAYHHMENVRRKTKTDDADSNNLVKHFLEKTNTEQFFYWNMQTDDEGRVMNFFFRDSRSLFDYECFGDASHLTPLIRLTSMDLFVHLLLA